MTRSIDGFRNQVFKIRCDPAGGRGRHYAAKAKDMWVAGYSNLRKKLTKIFPCSKIFPCLYVGILFLYGFVGYNSFGYDDEFFNIELIEQHGLNAISILQGTDIHPPGSYLANWALFSLFGNWSLVRLAVGLFSASVLIYTIDSVRSTYGVSSGWKACFFLGLNPAFLLWCTGLRWYAFFAPVLAWVSITPRTFGARYWAKCFCGLVVLGYFGYTVFIIALPVLILYWINSPNPATNKIKNILIYGSIASLAYLPQLIIFFTVHFQNIGTPFSSLRRSLVGFVVVQLSNPGVFPLSFGGIISAVGALGIIFVSLLFSPSAQLRTNGYFVSYWISSGLMILTGFAALFHPLVTISPLQGLSFSTIQVDKSKEKIFTVFCTFLAIGNLIGIFNVANHHDTTKNTWNLPIRATLDELEASRTSCNQDLVVLAHDPTLVYFLKKKGFIVLSPYRATPDERILQETHQCVVVLKTYAGSIDDRKFTDMYSELQNLHFDSKSKHSLGFDRYFKWKKMLDSRYPESQIEISSFKKVHNLYELKSWQCCF